MTDETKQPLEHEETGEFTSDFIDSFQRQIVDNKKIVAQYDAKYAKEPSNKVSQWQTSGALQSHTVQGNRVLLRCENAHAEFYFIADNVLRVRVQPENDDFSDYFSYYVEDTQSNLESLISQDEDDCLLLEVGSYRYSIRRDDSSLKVISKNTQFETKDGAIFSDDGQVGLSISLQDDEASYGTGERAFDLNLRGRKLHFWNTDPGGFERGDDPVNYCVSFYLGVNDTGAYGLLWDNSSRGIFDIGASNPDELKITSETGQLTYYLFFGKDVNHVMKSYTQVTGRMPMPPLWAIGYHQSRYSYMDEEEVLSTAQEMRERSIPCDAIYLDIHYMNGYRIFTWNKESFPDMKGMIDKLHAMGMKLVTILDPGTKVDEGYVGHDTGLEQDIFINYPDGKPVAGVVWPGLCYFPDFSSEKARQWWVEQLSPLLKCGVDGIWNDMNEPLVFDDEEPPLSLPDYTRQDKEGRGGNHLDLHNIYGTLMGMASRTALDKHRPNKRQFSIVRAGAAGAQRYTSSWTGDNHSTWDELALSISMTLQMGLSGLAFTGADIGGFGDDSDGELLVRWTQAGTLMPFFRNHSAVNSIRQEPWSFEETHEDIIREAIALRYRLMPYLYTAFAHHAFEGSPIIHPLFMAEPKNPQLRNIDDCYLLGEKILVAPILKPATIRRTVYLPEGDWYNFKTNQRHIGGKIINVEAPLNTLPIFIKSGTVLPMWPVMQHTGAETIETLTLRVYTDTGETRLYEDAGEGLDYQNGGYRWLTFHCEETSDSLTIERLVEGGYTPGYQQIEFQLIGARKKINKIEVDGEIVANWSDENGMILAIVKPDFEQVKMSV